MFRKLITKMKKRNYPRARGFSITEVAVASALLIICIVPILRALTSAQLNSVIIEHKTRSLTLAQGRLDEIKAQSIYNYDNSFSENNTSVDGLYLCNVTDSTVNDTLRKVTVSVGYDINGNNVLAADEIEVSLTTYIAKRW